MNRGVVEISPQSMARIGGLLYLFIIVVGIFGEAVIRGGFVVRDDPTATAENILASETLFLLGLMGDVLGYVAGVVLTLILYVLLRPVSQNLALLLAFFNIVSIGVFALNGIFHLAAMEVLRDPEYLNMFDQAQLDSLAYLALSLHSQGFAIALIFFGSTIILLGHLIYKSRFLPNAIGVLLVIGGVCYILNSTAYIMAPALSAILLPWLLLPPFLGELGLALWLTVKGVAVQEWAESAEQ